MSNWRSAVIIRRVTPLRHAARWREFDMLAQDFSFHSLQRRTIKSQRVLSEFTKCFHEHLHASEKKVSQPAGTPSVTACFGFGAVVQMWDLPFNKCISLPQVCGLPDSQSFLALHVCVICNKGSKGLRVSAPSRYI